jgi:regulator of protease activity HflC (stomatin/prohibitin superfamily)
MEPLLIVALVLVLFVVAVLVKAVRIVPQARARNVERLGRYQRTLTPGLKSSCRSWTACTRRSTCASRW